MGCHCKNDDSAGRPVQGAFYAPRPSHMFPVESFYGNTLAGASAMRFIFVDEAGTSANEPITVVAGVILHADIHLMQAEALLKEVLGAVPVKFREGFLCHADDVWNDAKYRDEWLLSDRLAFLSDMMRIPRRLNLAIAVGMVRRDARVGGFEEGAGLSLEQQQHFWAFHGCLARADKYIREYCDVREVGTVVAEDIPQMRRFLAGVTKEPASRAGFVSPAPYKETLQPTAEERELGYNKQQTETRITRIRKSIHFVKKGEDTMLQIADACAFGIRRYFSKLEFGDDFMHAILGGLPDRENYVGPYHYENWCWHPRKEQILQAWFRI